MATPVSVTAPPLRPVALAVAGLVLCASLPFWALRSDYAVGLLLQIAIYAGFGLSWHLLAGYTGQYSFGHATFFGTGAYATAILSYRADVSPWLGILVGAVAAAIVGIVVGVVTIRLTGLFFGLVTFGTSLVLGVLANHFVGLTGGAAGLSLPLRPGQPLMMSFDSQVPLYEITLLVVFVFLTFTWLVLRTRRGLLWRAVRDDEVAAEASGIPVRRVRIGALSVSAAMAGVVGGIYAQSLLFIDPTSAYGLTQSVNAIFTALIGGMGLIGGPIAGAVLFVLLRELGNVVSGGNGVYSVLFYSCVVFAVILFAPGGLGGIAGRLFRAVRDRGRRGSR